MEHTVSFREYAFPAVPFWSQNYSISSLFEMGLYDEAPILLANCAC